MKSTGCLAVLTLLTVIGLLQLAPAPPQELPRDPTSTPLPCRTKKINFTQAQGCFNDGSFEFCIPANDPAALDAVLRIAPGAACIQAGGRAHCDLNTQRLCMVETRGMCVGDYGAMNDSGWQTVCDLAALPFVTWITATWYE